MLKGDGSWAVRKILLGWILDAIRQTLELPAHRKLMLADIFEDLAGRKRCSAKKWERLLGKLRFVSKAIPGSAGLFCALQLALKRRSDGRIKITESLRHHINAFASLAASLSSRPTYLAELVEQEPTLLGATDAAKQGLGGIYYDSSGTPYVWRFPLPAEVQARLVSADNPSGSVTNSDTEHAALIAQTDIMAMNHDVAYVTLANGTDNTPANSRVVKGSLSSDGPAANLCNLACLHARRYRYYHKAFFLPGRRNVMADDASRLQHLTDDEFLSHFEQRYPQSKPWQLVKLRSEMRSCVIS
jgi:hypothetical protein